MKAKVDPDLCIGCGICPDICPEVFVIDGDLAKTIVETVPMEAEGSCQDATDACPVDAISLEK
jgi:ferredoxin